MNEGGTNWCSISLVIFREFKRKLLSLPFELAMRYGVNVNVSRTKSLKKNRQI